MSTVTKGALVLVEAMVVESDANYTRVLVLDGNDDGGSLVSVRPHRVHAGDVVVSSAPSLTVVQIAAVASGIGNKPGLFALRSDGKIFSVILGAEDDWDEVHTVPGTGGAA